MRTRKQASAQTRLAQDFEAGLNPEQVEVVRYEGGPLRVLALAGSGKTESLSRLIARLVAERGVAPSRILAVTFSKKGADEMSARIEKKFGVAGARVGTWHSLCYQIIREDRLPEATWKIEDSGPGTNAKVVLKDVLGWKGMDWKGADLSLVERFISWCKAHLWEPESAEASGHATNLFRWEAGKATRAFHLYNEALADKGLLTYDDFLVVAARHLRDENARASWASRWDYVLQDEGQDANLAQIEIANLLARDHRNYVAIGDCYQCHPAGVLVRRDDGGETPIEKLRDGDTVRAWNRKSQRMLPGRPIKVASRPYEGKLYRMRAAEREVEMTPNHRVLARWTDRGSTACVTYLMWRPDLGFRVGWCKLFAASEGRAGNYHFAQRCRLEKAHKAWILGVHEGRTDASVEESILAAAYGIPTATFEPVHGAAHLTEESIRRIFTGVDQWSGGLECTRDRAMAILERFDRHFDFPAYPWPGIEHDRVERVGRMTYFEVYAANLLPGLMSVPLPDATNAWTPIESVTPRPYKGLVYSLDVAEDHSYSANGLVVLNSIYGFRGSSPEYLARFEKDWPGARTIVLPRNYRSGRNIIDAANRIVSLAEVGGIEVPTQMIGERDSDGTVRVVCAESLDDEAITVAHVVQKSVAAGDSSYADHTVLFRTNAQSRAIEEALLKLRIPYVVVGGVSFYERKEVRDLLAYLRLAARRGTVDDIKRSINTPFRFLGAKFVERVMSAVDDADGEANWCRIVDEVAGQTGIQQRQMQSANEWARMIRTMQARIVAGETAEEEQNPEAIAEARPSALLEHVVSSTRYIDYLNKEEGGETTADSGAANVREMVRVAERFPTAAELLDYIDDTIKSARRQREDKQAGGERVLLMSIHRSKGLEWPHVYVVGMNEMVLPHAKGDHQEERRLAYVAATRARDVLTLSYVRRIATRAGIKDVGPSRFLLDTGLSLDAPRTPAEIVAQGGV